MMNRSALDSGSANALREYRRLVRWRVTIVVLLGLAVAASFVIDLLTGPSAMPLNEVIDALSNSSLRDTPNGMIVWEIRLPMAVLAVLAGGAIALAGAEMQTTLNNPLASPFTLGLSSAAIFGAALAITLGLRIPGVPDDWIVSANAFVFAIGTAALLRVLTRLRGMGVEGLVLFGTALFFTFNALVSILQYIAGPERLQQLVFFTMGSLGSAAGTGGWNRIAMLAVGICILLPWALFSARHLTALRLGEDRARSLGVNVTRLRRGALLRIALFDATAVAFVGTLPFVGLAGPHVARLLVGEDHRFFLPAAFFSGALVVSLASIASKVVIPGVSIPIGLVTSLIGVPFFIGLLLSRRERA